MLGASFLTTSLMRPTRTTFTWHDPYSRSFALWMSIARDNASMLWSASQVIGIRTNAMATGQSDAVEISRMVAEKPAAMFESSMAAWSESMRIAQTMWQDALRQSMAATALTTSPVRAGKRAMHRSLASARRQMNAPLQIANAAAKPVHRRVEANRRRLG